MLNRGLIDAVDIHVEIRNVNTKNKLIKSIVFTYFTTMSRSMCLICDIWTSNKDARMNIFGSKFDGTLV